jgi:hypothetical protein
MKPPDWTGALCVLTGLMIAALLGLLVDWLHERRAAREYWAQDHRGEGVRRKERR